MEKFMYIFHGGNSGNLSPEDMQAEMGKWMAWIDKLNKDKRYISGEPLLPGGKFVSGAGGKTITDGPFTEGKEVVGGFFIVEARDLDEAIALTEDYPDFDKGGKIQVRQVMKM